MYTYACSVAVVVAMQGCVCCNSLQHTIKVCVCTHVRGVAVGVTPGRARCDSLQHTIKQRCCAAPSPTLEIQCRRPDWKTNEGEQILL